MEITTKYPHPPSGANVRSLPLTVLILITVDAVQLMREYLTKSSLEPRLDYIPTIAAQNLDGTL